MKMYSEVVDRNIHEAWAEMTLASSDLIDADVSNDMSIRERRAQLIKVRDHVTKLDKAVAQALEGIKD